MLWNVSVGAGRKNKGWCYGCKADGYKESEYSNEVTYTV